MEIGKFRKLIENLENKDPITVQYNGTSEFFISHIEDSTSVGVWEIRITDYGINTLTVEDLKKQLDDLPEDDAIVVTEGNRCPDFKITGIDIDGNKIIVSDFKTNNPWEK